MNVGLLNLDQLDKPYSVVVQLKHQPPGVLHAVVLRPEKIKQTMRMCSLGCQHKSAVIVMGDTPGDQAAGWQYPENVYVVVVLGEAHQKEGSDQWEVRPIES